MIKYEDIRRVHLEISSLCNASCPWCPRTFWGYPYNGGYPEVNLTTQQARQIFSLDFLKQLDTININGNFGDIVMNPDAPEIVEYFKNTNADLKVLISTNGSARDKEFWRRLSNTEAAIHFCIDGLDDTHHLYRQNTVWSTVIKNAQTVIDAGGYAVWKMIKFDHNLHQIEECRQLSRQLGFKEFELIDDGRDTAPVFDRKGNLTHILGKYTGVTDFKVLFYKKKTDLILLEDITHDRIPKKSVNCNALANWEIYIAATGEVYPCCWTGFYPKTYGHGQYHQAANAQLTPLIYKNNALEYPLRECIEWFSAINSAWNISTYDQGRLVICDDNCGY